MGRNFNFLIFFWFIFSTLIIFPKNCYSCIDINTAPREDLIKIKHIGESRANQIIDLRKEELFYSLEDLNRIYGIGPARITEIKEQGLTCFNYLSDSLLRTKPETLRAESSGSQVEIVLDYPQKNPINKEIEIFLSLSGLKYADYDLKLSIEEEKNISSIYNQKENSWQSSHYYLRNLFSGSSFNQSLRLKIREDGLAFQGEANLVLRIRESGKTEYLEHKEKIIISLPEKIEEEIKDIENIFNQEPNSNFSKNISIGLIFASFSSILILVAKKINFIV